MAEKTQNNGAPISRQKLLHRTRQRLYRSEQALLNRNRSGTGPDDLFIVDKATGDVVVAQANEAWFRESGILKPWEFITDNR